jgi:glycosyltransferase involved in cell wall biosynthesis
MAAGCPVVASRSGGIPDLIADGETGILVQPADPIALAAELQRLLASPLLSRTIGDAARAKVEDFTATRVVPRIEQVYRETLATGGWAP